VKAFVDAVQSRANGRRVALATLWDAFASVAPVDASATDARGRLARTLRAAERDGAWRCSKRTDAAGRPPLPAFVELPAPELAAQPDPRAVAWRPELAWAAALTRLSDRQHHLLLAVNAFLRDAGGDRPLVPVEERSLELFDDEKAISGRAGGETLWGEGRLSLELLRCVPSNTPFAYERIGAGDRLLVAENQATFATLRDLLRKVPGHPYAAVVFGLGRSAQTSIGYLTELPFDVRSVDYFGDLDVDGLEMARACLEAARRAGVEAQLHLRLWQLLLTQRPTPAKPHRPARVEAACTLLPDPLHVDALTLLQSGQRIAQERCGRELLSATPQWWLPGLELHRSN
jgi:hypothetical protein